MLSLILAILLPVVLFLVSTAWSLFCNYGIARKVGLPVIIVPISPENPLWMLLARYVIPILQYVPFGNGDFSRFCHVGWEFEEKARAHIELGDAFIFATPGKNWIYLCDADAIHDIIKRERSGEFARPVELLAMLDVFGPNISTMNGSDWQRQRKCTAASFNEQSNALVWTESLRQGQQMLQYWKDNIHAGESTMAKDTRTLALDVLVHAAFGKSFDFYGARDRKITSGPLSYRDALAILLENAILILALGPKALKWLTFIPRLAQLSNAAEQFKQYMLDMFEEHAQQVQGEKSQGNLIKSLVRASLDEKLITQDEVIGNIFVFNFAGHDTTAHSLAFTFMLMAANPEVQEWMSEEIRYVLGDKDLLEADYSLMPRLVRTLAVLVSCCFVWRGNLVLTLASLRHCDYTTRL
jgi:cytochrome P450